MCGTYGTPDTYGNVVIMVRTRCTYGTPGTYGNVVIMVHIVHTVHLVHVVHVVLRDNLRNLEF